MTEAKFRSTIAWQQGRIADKPKADEQNLTTEWPAEERSRTESRVKRRNHGIARRNDLSKEVKKRCSGGDRDLWITAQSRFLRERISQPLVAPALLAKNR
jgi:hypothetical protein